MIPTKIKDMLYENAKLFVVLPNRDKVGNSIGCKL